MLGSQGLSRAALLLATALLYKSSTATSFHPRNDDSKAATIDAIVANMSVTDLGQCRIE